MTQNSAKVVGGMAMSLDGYINDRDGSVARLYSDFEALRNSELLQESMRLTKAVVMGRHAFDMASGDFTGYEYQVPIFVLTHHPPTEPMKGQNENLKIHFVTDGVESAVRQAKTAAGDGIVTVVGGASTIRQCLKAGLLDELHVDIVPVLLEGGQRFFEPVGLASLQLESRRVMESPGYIHLKFRVVK
jgi:dihydrofolate reductase